ncbi:uncharacterized protein [Watersipora subatra]|uniref:uncharacterized protein n=1 Tax=Watersipora subatra TaxID=2589382 RepID=UPI00355BB841
MESSAAKLFCLGVLSSLVTSVAGVGLRTRNTLVVSWVIVLIVLLIVGLLTLFVIEVVILYKIFKLKGVPCRSIWLGQLLLFAIGLSYCSLLVFIFQPTEIVCSLVRFFPGVCFILIQSVLILKLLLVMSPKTQGGFLKLGHQWLILLLIWAVQLVINIQWIILKPFQVITIQDDLRICVSTNSPILFADFLYSFIYIFVMGIVIMALSTILYWNNHRSSNKPNSETKWILVTGCITTATWLAWILAGALIPDWSVAALAIGLWVTATVTLLTMFLPKLHKLSALKDGEFYIEDEIPGLGPHTEGGEIIEMNGGIAMADSHLGNGVVVSEPDGIHLTHPPSTLERSPSVILEEQSNASASSIGPSPSLLFNSGNPHALELRHPTSQAGSQYYTMSHDEESYSEYESPRRYYTIGGHGRRSGSNSVIGVPRYERRYIQIPNQRAQYHSLDPKYVRAVPVSPYHHLNSGSHTFAHPGKQRRYAASVVSMPPQRQVIVRPSGGSTLGRHDRGSTRRFINGYTNQAFRPHDDVLYADPDDYTVPRRAVSVIDVPSYRPKISRPAERLPNGASLHRTLSQQDLKVPTNPVSPQPNGSVVGGTLPRRTNIYKQAPNGRISAAEHRQHVLRNDRLETSSVY